MIGQGSNPMGYFQVFVGRGIPPLQPALLLHAPCLGCGSLRSALPKQKTPWIEPNGAISGSQGTVLPD